MALFWTAGMVAYPQYFSLPMQLFLIPVIGFFFAKAIFGIVLYRARVPCSWYDTLMASLASMGLSHAIARGILHGLTREKTVVRGHRQEPPPGRAATSPPSRRCARSC